MKEYIFMHGKNKEDNDDENTMFKGGDVIHLSHQSEKDHEETHDCVSNLKETQHKELGDSKIGDIDVSSLAQSVWQNAIIKPAIRSRREVSN